MHTHNCQNCGEPVLANYCAECGQKASTHRFSTRHILEHDFIHGVFHVDKGLLYTAKQLLTRPGYSIREYVEGKRVNHFNYITLLLLLIAAHIFITASTGFKISSIPAAVNNTNSVSGSNMSAISDELQTLLQAHMKELYLILIPVSAVITWIGFSKAKQNYAEHLVMNAYMTAGALLIQDIFLLIAALSRNGKVALVVQTISILPLLIYSISFYKQYFNKDYSNKFLLRMRALIVWQIAAAVSAISILTIAYFINPSIFDRFLQLLHTPPVK